MLQRLALSSDTPATTIHRKIYRQKSLGGDFSLDINLHADTLFIVDEASMISTEPQVATAGMPMFLGNGGGLIDDLVTYVYSGKNCRLMLIGDTAQLPPIGEDEAPALQKGVMECYGLNVYEYDIMEVVRQKSVSGILWNANQIRFLITHDSATELPKIKFSGFADIWIIPSTFFFLSKNIATSLNTPPLDASVRSWSFVDQPKYKASLLPHIDE